MMDRYDQLRKEHRADWVIALAFLAIGCALSAHMVISIAVGLANASARGGAVERAPSLTASTPPVLAPLVVVIEQATVAYAPDGARVSLPAGSEIDVCASNNTMIIYDLLAMAIRVPTPCVERPLFADSFEGERP